ncbi:MAG: 2-amino-4-hydroxy-6-hydroxymethyldihydropteridine diphosphokinase [Gammaproteobacteria bacterium]
MRAYVGLGANLGDPPAQIRSALQALARLPQTRLLRSSRLYRTAPLGLPGQADYCNAACSLESALDPPGLMQALLGLERAAGRERDGRRWGPRTLDLDLLHVVGVQLQTPGLCLPHPELARRNFVLAPLAEIEPTLDIPGVGEVAALLAAVGRAGLQDWAD